MKRKPFPVKLRDSRYFDLYKVDMETLETKMVYKNDNAYTYNSISNNDKYLVFDQSIARGRQNVYIQRKQNNKLKFQKKLILGSGFDKDDKNYYYTTNFDGEFHYLMSYNIKTKKRDLVYKTDWDVVNSSLSKNDSYRIVTVNEDAQNKIIVENNKDGSELKFEGLDNLNINSVSFSDDETLVRINAASSVLRRHICL